MSRLVLVTGATGYVGGRLVPPLLERGYRVRCAVRRPNAARKRLPPAAEIVKSELLEPETLGAAMVGVDTAFYLVHALGSGGDLWREETLAATNFAAAAEKAGVRRIVYLGGRRRAQRIDRHGRLRRAAVPADSAARVSRGDRARLGE